MNFKHLSIGLILMVIGLVLAPTLTPEDLITTVPLIAAFGIEIYAILAIIGYFCLILGALLVGANVLRHFGLIGKVIIGHPKLMLISVVIAGIIVFWWVSYGS